MGCCGPTWGFRPNTINLSDSEDEEQRQEGQQQLQEQLEQSQELEINAGPARSENVSGPNCVGRVPLNSGGMNLAAALAAERHLRAADGTNLASPTTGIINTNNNVGPAGTAPGTPLRVSLMRLLAETDGCDGEEKARGAAGGGEVGSDSVCCVCMGRKKGAAFIPCGHTFCRVCSREMWLNRGSCPLCNRSILEILDIF